MLEIHHLQIYSVLSKCLKFGEQDSGWISACSALYYTFGCTKKKRNKGYIIKQLRWEQCSYIRDVEVPRCPEIVAIIVNCTLHLGQICSNVSVFVSVGIRGALLLSAGKCFTQNNWPCKTSSVRLWWICSLILIHMRFLLFCRIPRIHLKGSSFRFWRCLY